MGSPKYKHPARDEICWLYLECGHTIKEIAEVYDIPNSVMTYIICVKYRLKRTPELLKRRREKQRFEYIREKTLTKKKLESLYIGEKMTLNEIWTHLHIGQPLLNYLFKYYNIPKRSASEYIKLGMDRKIELQKEDSKTYTHRKIDEVKQKIDEHIIDPNSISHSEACRLVSCNPGIEKLKQICDVYGYDFEILANTYRKLEKIFYKLNLYPKTMIKIALTLFIRYDIQKHIIATICRVSTGSIRKYEWVFKYLKLPLKERRSDPLTMLNIGWIFKK